MFSNLNFWEIGALLLLALFIFGPERLPKVISDGVRMLRNVRDMARNATSDLSRELGTEVRLEDLHPKAFIRKHLLSEEEEAQLRRPFDDAFRDVKQIAQETTDAVRPAAHSFDNLGRRPADAPPPPTPRSEPTYGSAYGKDNGFPATKDNGFPASAPEDRRYDSSYGGDSYGTEGYGTDSHGNDSYGSDPYGNPYGGSSQGASSQGTGSHGTGSQGTGGSHSTEPPADPRRYDSDAT